MTALATWQVAKPIYNVARSKVLARIEHVVTVRDTDEVFLDLQRWLLDQMPPNQKRSLTISTRTQRSADYESAGVSTADSGDGPRKTRPTVSVIYDGEKPQTVTIKGHQIRVSIEQSNSGNYLLSEGSSPMARDLKMTFTTRSVAGREAVIELIDELAALRSIAKPRCMIATRWGGWERHDELMTRSAESVILEKGLKEGIFENLRQFRSHEKDYQRLGIPFHHGILLHGPPGGGKSSVARAVASELNLDVYYMPLSDMKADTQLLNMVANVRPNSVLLLEDIDIVRAATSRDDEGDGATLSGLLNALDGMLTPHGLITIMTTNDVDALDDALIRDGRTDDRWYIGNLVPEQFDRLVTHMVGMPPLVTLQDGVVLSASTVVGVAKAHLDDPHRALCVLAELAHPEMKCIQLTQRSDYQPGSLIFQSAITDSLVRRD